MPTHHESNKRTSVLTNWKTENELNKTHHPPEKQQYDIISTINSISIFAIDKK